MAQIECPHCGNFKVYTRTPYFVNRRTGQRRDSTGNGIGYLLTIPSFLILICLGLPLVFAGATSVDRAGGLVAGGLVAGGFVISLVMIGFIALGAKVIKGNPANFYMVAPYTCRLCGKEWGERSEK